MTRLERNVNIAAVLLPFLVVVVAVPLLWGRVVGPSDRWWELDLSALTIRLMRRVGLAWDAVLITPARQEQKLAAP